MSRQLQFASLHHASFEGLGYIAEWIAERGHSVRQYWLCSGDAVPTAEDFDALIVMGGPMNVDEHEQYPWLVGEKALIRAAIESGKPVFGVCLGAQLIARALGSPVYRNPYREIGWFPVELTPDGARSPLFAGFPPYFEAFHWHGETFDLPDGCQHLLRSEGCEHQAIAFDGGRVLGLQCHLEMQPDGAAALGEHCTPDLAPARYVQPLPEMLKSAGYQRTKPLLAQLLDGWLSLSGVR